MRRYTERVSFMVPFGEKAKLKRKAAAFGISISELIRQIAERTDDDHDKETHQ